MAPSSLLFKAITSNGLIVGLALVSFEPYNFIILPVLKMERLRARLNSAVK